MNKKTGVLVLAAFAGLIGWRVHGRLTRTVEDMRRGGLAVPVEVAAVETRGVRDLRTFTGTLQADSSFVLAPKVSGRLEQLTVHIGDEVRRGQLVARLEDAEYVQQVEQAKAELVVAEARLDQCKTQLDLAQREFDRAQELRAKKISSQAEFDMAEVEYKTKLAELKVMQAQKAQKEAALRAAEVRLGYTRIEAAWQDGSGARHVGQRFVDEGEMLTANEPVLTIVDIHRLQAVVRVTERDYPLMRVGQKTALMVDAFPGEIFAGEVLRIASILSEASREAMVEVMVPNPGLRLKPGMFVRVRVEFAVRESATVIPRSAQVRFHDQIGVFRLDPAAMTVRFVGIEPGIQQGDWIEVVSPRLDGQVVTLGHHLLRDGAAVRLPEALRAAPDGDAQRPGRGEGGPP